MFSSQQLLRIWQAFRILWKSCNMFIYMCEAVARIVPLQQFGDPALSFSTAIVATWAVPWHSWQNSLSEEKFNWLSVSEGEACWSSWQPEHVMEAVHITVDQEAESGWNQGPGYIHIGPLLETCFYQGSHPQQFHSFPACLCQPRNMSEDTSI